MYQDKTLVCKECGVEFVFSAGEQEFYAERELDAPQRCKECRNARKSRQPHRVMYEIVCAQCGKVDKIPFEPRHDIAIYCNECYNKNKEN